MIAWECSSTEIVSITVAPVVVKPLMLSKSALIGWAIAPVPARMYGNAPNIDANSQVNATTKNASRAPGVGSGSSRRRRRPNPAVTTIETMNTHRSSPPYSRAVTIGTTNVIESKASSVPTSASPAANRRGDAAASDHLRNLI